MKNILFAFFSLFFMSLSAQQNKGFQLSSHILDISKGKPATNVYIELQKFDEPTKQWISVEKKITDSNGHVSDFLSNQSKDNKGKYKLIFFTEDYYNKQNIESFYPYIEVVFLIKDKEHYHVPITLSPFGYSTYRGS